MFIKQSDLLWGLDKEFVANIMEVSRKEYHPGGTFLFKEGDPANNVYIFLRGHVRLKSETKEHVIHTVGHAGETFGWSGLVGRDRYSASAKCTEDTTLLRFSAEDILRIAEDDPVNGMTFFKHLSNILGNRLIKSYQMIHSDSVTDTQETYGTGQMIASDLSI